MQVASNRDACGKASHSIQFIPVLSQLTKRRLTQHSQCELSDFLFPTDTSAALRCSRRWSAAFKAGSTPACVSQSERRMSRLALRLPAQLQAAAGCLSGWLGTRPQTTEVLSSSVSADSYACCWLPAVKRPRRLFPVDTTGKCQPKLKFHSFSLQLPL